MRKILRLSAMALPFTSTGNESAIVTVNPGAETSAA